MVVPIESFDKNHLYGGASDPLSQAFRELELYRVEEEHLGRVVVVHAPRHPRRHRELSRTVVHAHLEIIFKRGNVERSYLAIRVNSGQAVGLKAVTIHSATSTHLKIRICNDGNCEKPTL